MQTRLDLLTVSPPPVTAQVAEATDYPSFSLGLEQLAQRPAVLVQPALQRPELRVALRVDVVRAVLAADLVLLGERQPEVGAVHLLRRALRIGHNRNVKHQEQTSGRQFGNGILIPRGITLISRPSYLNFFYIYD